MDQHQEIQQIRALAEAGKRDLDALLSRLNSLEQRILKDTPGKLRVGHRYRFKNGPTMVLLVLRKAVGPISKAELLKAILVDCPELQDDMDYAQRAIRNALQVLKRDGLVDSKTPNGRLRDTVWWACGSDQDRSNKTARPPMAASVQTSMVG